mgnify:CR=1 FL=1
MKTILLNGCSFAERWEPSDKFVSSFGCDNLINLGKSGTSFQRTCRSTVEWVAQNGNPDFENITENNLQLKENSAAINFGNNIGIPLDILGNTRIGIPDLGAYEFQP